MKVQKTVYERKTVWDGCVSLSGNTFETITPIKIYNIEKTVTHYDPRQLKWKKVATGGFVGFGCDLTDHRAGALTIETA